MTRITPRLVAAGLVATFAVTACAPRATETPAQPSPRSGTASNGPASSTTPSLATRPGYEYVDADVHFMTGMIGHHGQALVMAGWAPTHGASDAVKRMAERIVVGQGDEINLMSRWLRDRNLPVPDPAAPMDHSMPGMDHSGMMPGMLTPAQMAELDAARGAEFDRKFLTFMMQHHTGALTMVNTLFGSQGAGQNEPVFRLASDVYADQSTEIERMQKMLAALPPAGGAH